MTLGKPSGKRVINCSGTEARLIDCPFEMLPSSETCSYLLVECNGTLQPTVGPTAAATKVLHTPVSTVSATSLAGSTFTVPAVVSSPDISAPQSTSVDGPPIAILATATSLVVAITAIGVTLLFSLIIYIRWKRSTLKQQTESGGHLSNPVYGAPIIAKSKSEGGETDTQETEESATLYNPLYSLPNGVMGKHNGGGLVNSRFPYESPEYSIPDTSPTAVYETPTISSPSISPDPTPVPPPHHYDYATVPPHTDPEYAPLEEATRSRQSIDAIEGAPATYHTLEPPENPVTYHVLEPPCPLTGTPDMSQENSSTGQYNEYSKLEHK
jgi:hypothetical protein